MQKQTEKKKLIWISLVAVILVATAVILWMVFPRGESSEDRSVAGIRISDEATSWEKELEDTSEGQQGIKIPGYGEITVASGETTWNITLLNPEGNECFFTYSVTLKSDGTRLYQTGLIKPGTAVTSFQAEKKLEKGEYPIIILVEASDMKEPEKKYNGGAVEAVLEVK